jgi:hypothetical protein
MRHAPEPIVDDDCENLPPIASLMMPAATLRACRGFPLRRTLSLAGAALAALLVAACAAPPPAGVAGEPVAASPAPWQGQYEELARRGRPVLAVDSARSLVTIEVRRGGRLAQFGHDHVVASHALRGYVAPLDGRADLSIPLRELVVDEAPLRQAAGFDTQPTPEDIEGTRANMMNKVLHVDQHPFAFVALTGVRDVRGPAVLAPSITLNGVTRPTRADVAVETTPDGMRITGRATVLQTDFGLVPFSILGGALEVQDALTIRFEIVARTAAFR